jgi:hypothetical protein
MEQDEDEVRERYQIPASAIKLEEVLQEYDGAYASCEHHDERIQWSAIAFWQSLHSRSAVRINTLSHADCLKTF